MKLFNFFVFDYKNKKEFINFLYQIIPLILLIAIIFWFIDQIKDKYDII